jgi:alkenylglycerophosphocholine hydrolase
VSFILRQLNANAISPKFLACHFIKTLNEGESVTGVLALTLRREFNPFDKALMFVSALSSLFYLLTIDFQPFPGSVVIKALSIAPIAWLAFRVLKTLDGLILSLVFIFSCIGDVMLGLHREDYFVYGLIAFLIAHLFYTWLFTRNFPGFFRVSQKQQLVLLLLAIYSAAMTVWLWSGLGDMRIPGLVYLCVITLMCMTAILANFSHSSIVFGALLFLLSDSFIAINKFKMQIPYSNYAIWFTYYLGQCLIALGFLREKLRA